ncbi:BnaC03g13580D [Brassica napus]|uniref:(rape) hypothetical protein n=1 Tax=Brassica napus TaxID=3708 RepID=A0A078FG14_BRANA|nr:unnamed protein product [Brassica napus]CDY11932.1 BnaC03g13580D [Brassica napus]
MEDRDFAKIAHTCRAPNSGGTRVLEQGRHLTSPRGKSLPDEQAGVPPETYRRQEAREREAGHD